MLVCRATASSLGSCHQWVKFLRPSLHRRLDSRHVSELRALLPITLRGIRLPCWRQSAKRECRQRPRRVSVQAQPEQLLLEPHPLRPVSVISALAQLGPAARLASLPMFPTERGHRATSVSGQQMEALLLAMPTSTVVTNRPHRSVQPPGGLLLRLLADLQSDHPRFPSRARGKTKMQRTTLAPSMVVAMTSVSAVAGPFPCPDRLPSPRKSQVSRASSERRSLCPTWLTSSKSKPLVSQRR